MSMRIINLSRSRGYCKGGSRQKVYHYEERVIFFTRHFSNWSTLHRNALAAWAAWVDTRMELSMVNISRWKHEIIFGANLISSNHTRVWCYGYVMTSTTWSLLRHWKTFYRPLCKLPLWPNCDICDCVKYNLNLQNRLKSV